MAPEQITEILTQHQVIMTEIENVYVVLAIVAFLLLAFMGMMFAAAAWSVRVVNRRQESLEGKFALLIDVLLRQAERDIQTHNLRDTGT